MLTPLETAAHTALLSPRVRGEKFLQFYWQDQERVLVSLSQISGVVSLTLDQILPVPGLPAAIMGACEWRGEVIWAVDLGAWLGLPPLAQEPALTRCYSLLVFQTDAPDRSRPSAPVVGGVVVEVGDIETLTSDQLQSPTAGIFSPQLQSVLRGYVPHSGEPVLEVTLLLQALTTGSESHRLGRP